MALSTLYEHRYKFKAQIYNTRQKLYDDVAIFLDTGCFNTMIPRYLAEQSGHSLGFKITYSLGGGLIEAEAFSINKLVIGGFTLERVIAFAGNYKGRLEDDIILGTNVINNWEVFISKYTHTFKFREAPPDSLPNKAYIYQNYFNRAGNYICVQDT